MSDSSIVIIQGTVGLYTVATRCHTCFAVTLKYTEDSSLTILRHSLIKRFTLLKNVCLAPYLISFKVIKSVMEAKHFKRTIFHV